MKNLTSGVIILMRQDGTRATLPASPLLPTIEDIEPALVGYLGDLRIIRQQHKRVNFHGLTDNLKEQPFVVSREVFDVLPDSAVEFITPDYESAIVNGLGLVHVIRCFIAKPDVEAVPERPFPSK
jgi:hypothetical protein